MAVDTKGLTLARTWYSEDLDGGLIRHQVFRHPISGACIRIDTAL